MSWWDLSATRGLVLKAGGVALLLAGLGLVAMTELGLMQHGIAAQRHGGDVVDARQSGPQPDMHGRMVHVSGPVQVVRAARDDDFNLSVARPVLIRHVEMFQWREVRIGDAVHYELDWVDRPLDARRFRQPKDHRNPGNFPVQGKQFDAGLVRVGGFVLGPVLLHALPGTEPVAPQPQQLPANLAASFSLYRNRLVTSADPAHPRLGDVRVSWEAVPVQPVTIFARLEGDRLVPAAEAADGRGYELQAGERTLNDLLPDVPPQPDLVMARRILAVLLAALGSFLLLLARDHGRYDALLALATGTALIGAVACALWLGVAWPMVLGWFAVTTVASLLAIWRLRAPHA